jgi:beta-phosphoglucomutase-like phosphatase (HAD superfamily)
MENPKQTHLVNGAEAFLDYLKEQKVPFILASASITENVDFYFQQFGLERWFTRSQCVYDDGTYANKGEMHIEAARRLGTTVPDCIVVEDSISAVTHARENRAGCIVAIGKEDNRSRLIQAGADHYIHDFTEFDKRWLEMAMSGKTSDAKH